MKPLAFVIFQLLVLVFIFVAVVRRNPSVAYRGLYVAAVLGVAGGLDVWYLGWHAYPGGFAW